MNEPLYDIWELAKRAIKIIDAQTIKEYTDIDIEHDICHELTDSEIKGRIINLKGMTRMI
ncbi:hypothetical protein HZS_7978 [Henneguya salminicola]|nr:hypothetical protein HZS_7978 [Henneguya salminicola]